MESVFKKKHFGLCVERVSHFQFLILMNFKQINVPTLLKYVRK
jgi:hypothetical protein